MVLKILSLIKIRHHVDSNNIEFSSFLLIPVGRKRDFAQTLLSAQ